MMTMAVTHPKQSDIWWLFLLQGAAGIILGLMLLTAPGLTTVALVTFLGYYWLIMGFGVLLLAEGIALIVLAFRVRA